MSPIDAINNAKTLVATEPHKAKAMLLEVLNENPEYHDGWALLANIHKLLQEHEQQQSALKQYEMIHWFNKQLDTAKQQLTNQNPLQAQQTIQQLLKLVPNEYRALETLAEIAFKVGDSKAYFAISKHNLENNSQKQTVKESYCKALLNTKQFDELISFYHSSISSPTLYIESLLAIAHVKLMQFDEATTIYNKLLDANYYAAQCHLRLGNIEKIKGNTGLAIDHYKQALQIDKKLGEAYWNLANLKTYIFDSKDVDFLEQLTQAAKPNLNSAQFYFALAKAYEQQGNFSLSFAMLEKANSIQKSLTPYKPSNFTSRCTQHLTQKPMAHNTFDESLQLIFIVSLPRSGSTLVEQILASHPDADASYELTEINAIARELESKKLSDVPYGLDKLSEQDKAHYAARYLNFIAPLRGKNKVFIDKQPANFHHIALIKTLFPNAKILEVTRDKAATAWSLYKHSFSEGHAYSYDFKSLAQYINDYADLMSHWHALYPDEIFNVDYQNLVNDFSNTVSELLDYCSLEMHESCMSFYNHQRPIMTPSSEQVRQPIYKDALTQWTNYKVHLEPLLKLIK